MASDGSGQELWLTRSVCQNNSVADLVQRGVQFLPAAHQSLHTRALVQVGVARDGYAAIKGWL